MSFETEKAERTVQLYTMIVLGVILISILIFNNIIDIRKNYCEFDSSKIQCYNMKQVENGVKLTLKINDDKFAESVVLEFEKCEKVVLESVDLSTEVKITTQCADIISAKKTFKGTSKLTIKSFEVPKVYPGKFKITPK